MKNPQLNVSGRQETMLWTPSNFSLESFCPIIDRAEVTASKDEATWASRKMSKGARDPGVEFDGI